MNLAAVTHTFSCQLPTFPICFRKFSMCRGKSVLGMLFFNCCPPLVCPVNYSCVVLWHCFNSYPLVQPCCANMPTAPYVLNWLGPASTHFKAFFQGSLAWSKKNKGILSLIPLDGDTKGAPIPLLLENPFFSFKSWEGRTVLSLYALYTTMTALAVIQSRMPVRHTNRQQVSVSAAFLFSF